MKAATITDVARRANVHKSTVSRVLNKSDNVSEDTKVRVLKAMSELGFSPNRAAQTLATGRKKIVGFVYSEQGMSEVAQNPFFSTVVKGISNFAEANGFNILLMTAPGSKFESILEVVNGQVLDGLIINSSSGNDEFYKILNERGVPYVSIGAPGFDSDACYVDFDNYEGAYIGTKYLIERGHVRPRLIVNSVHGKLLLHNQRRIEGFKKAMKDYDLTLDDQSVIEIPLTYEAVERVVKHLCYDCDSIIVSNEVVAISLLNSLMADSRLSVPRDVSLVAFGDRRFYQFMKPTYTTIHQDVEWVGEAAARVLWNRIHGEMTEPEQIMAHMTLVEGGTCLTRAPVPK